jgi:histone-lysine N-methyltransferase SETMAR
VETSWFATKEEVQKCPLCQKNVLTFFWDMKGAILEHYQAKGQTAYSAPYSDMHKDKLKPAICNKRRGLLSKIVFLHHDDAYPHVVGATIETIRNFKSEVMPHPPYCPDLAPCNFYVFGPLKEALCGHWFGSDVVKEAVHK